MILYGIMGLYKKCVHLALSIDDFELAKEYANKAPQMMQKELWLLIIQEMIKTDDHNK